MRKRQRSTDIVTDPPARVVEITPTGERKSIIGVITSDPYVVHNRYSKRYEIAVQFAGNEKSYLVVADALDWERIVAGIMRALKAMPTGMSN